MDDIDKEIAKSQQETLRLKELKRRSTLVGKSETLHVGWSNANHVWITQGNNIGDNETICVTPESAKEIAHAILKLLKGEKT